MTDEIKVLTTLERIQQNHQENLDKMSSFNRDRTQKTRGSVPNTPPDMTTVLLQQIFDSVTRIESFIRANYPANKSIFDAQREPPQHQDWHNLLDITPKPTLG
jgi:hypothetical protein